MWIARTKGMPVQVHMFTSKPYWSTVDGWTCGRDCDNFEIGRIGWFNDIDGKMCPNLTEDEPIEVEFIQTSLINKFKDYVVDKVKDDVVLEHTCDTCKFKNENPRCSKGIPCSEWRKSNNSKIK